MTALPFHLMARYPAPFGEKRGKGTDMDGSHASGEAGKGAVHVRPEKTQALMAKQSIAEVHTTVSAEAPGGHCECLFFR